MKKTIILTLTTTIFLVSSDAELERPHYTGNYARDKTSAEHLEYIKKYPKEANLYKRTRIRFAISSNETKPIESKYSIDFDKNSTCLVRKIAIYKNPKWLQK